MRPNTLLTRLSCTLALLLLPLASARADEGDLKRQIEVQQAAVADLERLDDTRVVVGETTLLRRWLDEAWGLQSKEEYDQVRLMLDRCMAQAEFIRQKIAGSKLSAQAAAREAQVKASREKVLRTKQALEQTFIKKKAMEMNIK